MKKNKNINNIYNPSFFNCIDNNTCIISIIISVFYLNIYFFNMIDNKYSIINAFRLFLIGALKTLVRFYISNSNHWIHIKYTWFSIS
jgi:hypothetical protein